MAVALRVNPDIDPDTHPYLATGLRESKFGVAMAEAEALALGADVVATDIARFVELLEARATGKMRATGTS